MSEWIEQDHMDDNHLYVHLKNPELLDLSIFDRFLSALYVDKRKNGIDGVCDRRLYSFT